MQYQLLKDKAMETIIKSKDIKEAIKAIDEARKSNKLTGICKNGIAFIKTMSTLIML